MEAASINTQEVAWTAVILRDIAEFWHLILPGVAALVVAFFQSWKGRGKDDEILKLRDRVSRLEQKLEDIDMNRERIEWYKHTTSPNSYIT